MAEHRVPVLSGALHRYVDPARSSDPRIREIVAALGTLEPAPAPRAHFRAELRAQLVAVTPRLVAEGEPSRPSPEPAASRRRLPHLRLGHKVRVAAAALTVLVMALTGAVWLSRSAVPGDALYGLKRASENAQFSLTSGDVARAKDLLSFAKTRADEVSTLLGNASASAAGPQADGISAHTASLVTSTLGSADDDVQRAARLLGGKAVADRSAGPLDVMTAWAPGQQGRLAAIVSRIPAGALHARAQQSADLVAAAFARAQQLRAQLGCGCLANGHSDELGPVPCTTCTAPNHAPTPSAPGSSTPARPAPHGSTTAPAPNRPGSPRQGSSGSSGGGGTAPAPGGGATPTPTGPLPTLPLPTLPLPTSPPVTADSCGASVSLGPILVGVGTCGIHLHI
jgi:hypothetical protein